MTNVYEFNESQEAGRPTVVTYDDPESRLKTEKSYELFQVNAEVSAGAPDYPRERWVTPVFRASLPGNSPAYDWDYSMLVGAFGVFSQRGLDILSPYFADRFEPLPAVLEGVDVWCLRCLSRIDCLDKAASQIKYFRDTSDVMRVKSFVFDTQKLAEGIVFAISELNFRLFCTDPVPEVAKKARLRGIDFERIYEEP